MYHVNIMAIFGPLKLLNLATPLMCKGRFIFMMGPFQRHQIYLTFSAIVRWLGQQVSGQKTTYHILVWCRQGILCTGSTCEIMSQLHVHTFMFICTLSWSPILMMCLYFSWGWMEEGGKACMCPMGWLHSLYFMFCISGRALGKPWLFQVIHCFLVRGVVCISWEHCWNNSWKDGLVIT